MRATSSTRLALVERGHAADRAALAVARFRHLEMMVAARGDLRQVRHAQHLTRLPELMQQTSDHFGDAAADPRIHFVEDQGRRRAGGARDHREREADPRQFAAGGDLRERPQRHAGMTGDAELDLLEPVRAAFRQRHQRDFEAAAFHRQFLHAGRDRCAQSLAGLGAGLRQLFRFRRERLPWPWLRPRAGCRDRLAASSAASCARRASCSSGSVSGCRRNLRAAECSASIRFSTCASRSGSSSSCCA